MPANIQLAASRTRRQTGRRPRVSSRRWIRFRSGVVVVIAVLSAAGAILADAAPTDLPVVDPALRALLALIVPLTAAHGRRWSWAAAAGAVLLASSPDPGLFVAALASFAVAVATSVLDFRSRVIGALLGAAVVQTALRLPTWGPMGTSALVGGFAATVLVMSGVRNLRRRTRRRIRLAVVAAAGTAVVCSAGFVVSVILARSEAQAGADAARAGISAAQAGHTRRAIRHFGDALVHLRAAQRRLDQPWSRVARIMPVIGQHERAVRRLVDHAVSLAETGAFAARSADVEALRAVNGRIDPAAIEALRAPLLKVDAALTRTRRDLPNLGSPWLLGPVRAELDDLRASLRDASHDTRTALLAAEVGPALLGADGPRRYFVMFTTPAEARASAGGFMGNWGVLTAHDGRLDLTRFGRTQELNQAGDSRARHVESVSDYLARYERFGAIQDWRNVNMSPDFPTVAEVVGQLYPQSGGEPVDGVLAIDPKGLARILRLTGPVEVAGLAEPLTAENAARILLRDQYIAFPETAERVGFLERAAEAVTERFTTSSLPGPRTVGQTLGPAVRERHLFFVTTEPEANRLLERLGTTGRVGAGPGDTFGLVTQNATGSKLELFLHRSVELVTRIDPSAGRQQTRATIRLRNDAPADGLPPYVIGNALGLPAGTNRLYLSLYTPLTLAGATLDGKPLRLGVARELGLNVYSQYVTIPPGSEAVVELDLRGPLRLVRHHGQPRYRLDVWRQTMVHPDELTTSVSVGDAWRLEPAGPGLQPDDGSVTFRGTQGTPVRLEATIRG